MKKLLLLLAILIITAFSACSPQSEQPRETVPKTEPIYEKATELTAYKGIDVSSYSGSIDWKSVKKQGISFAMVRLGGRGFGDEGSLYADKTALDNIDSAQKYGIEVGAYFFSQALTKAEAKQEAKYCAKLLGSRKLDLPIAYDLEKLDDTETRVENLPYKTGLYNAKVFMKTVEKLGFKSAVYIEKNGFLKARDFDEAQVWYSDFGKAYKNSYLMLQYSKEGRLKGIDGSVDLDVMYR